ncbi:MAG: hypothetical protein WKF78_12690 [Candidatus Limnocylindrales bacterium]
MTIRRPGRGRGSPAQAVAIVPADPRRVLDGSLDPAILAIRSALAGHRRRLWFRRIVRRSWIALAVVAVSEALLWMVARIIPLESASLVAVGLPVLAAVGLLVAAVMARPSIGETALAVDGEGGLGDRISSALELAVAFPASAGPHDELEPGADVTNGPVDEATERDRSVRRQRGDALAAVRLAPALFKPRFSRAPAVVTLAAILVLVPVLVLPNPQDAVIAQQRDVREAADRQAERLDKLADELAVKGQTPEDPRTKLAQELRDLARKLRERPTELATNLRQLASVESDVRARLDPSTEQKASALTSLSRALSRAATGDPQANRDGDPKKTQEDLDRLAEKLEALTPEEQAELAKQLAEMGATASEQTVERRRP